MFTAAAAKEEVKQEEEEEEKKLEEEARPGGQHLRLVEVGAGRLCVLLRAEPSSMGSVYCLLSDTVCLSVSEEFYIFTNGENKSWRKQEFIF